MKPRPPLMAFLCLLFVFLCAKSYGQAIGVDASAVWLSDCLQSDFFNTTGSGADLIGPSANSFSNANLGVHTQNSGSLFLRGGEVRSFKDPSLSNVCSARIYYRVYLQSATPGAFQSMDLPLIDNCGVSGQFPSGGTCQPDDQKWSRVVDDGTTSPYAPVNLTGFAPGNYVLEVYYEITGSNSSTTLCNETITVNNGGTNYKAFFSIQGPVLASNNPVTCNGSDGFITISGLAPGAAYDFDYVDDGLAVGPLHLVANGSGQIKVNNLNAGVYSNFSLTINGCTTDLFIGTILTNPVFTPTFSKIVAFCAGTTPPTLPPVSLNGISGTWSPSVIDNQVSGTYTFTPNSGQCGMQYVINVTVIPRVTPTFSFGTALTICSGGSVPALTATSTNGIPGVWSPAIVDNQNSGTYTFTPNNGVCALPATFTVTVTPNVVPMFAFGPVLSFCAGNTVPALPTLSLNGITGVWNPATIDNQNSANYTFTPTSGQCATPTSVFVTINPNEVPVFAFGSSLSACAGSTVPLLPTTSTNGLTGTWTPAVINNQASGTYTFTPTAGLCAFPATLNVTINPLIVPIFSFGTSLSVCAGGIVPALPSTSNNGINGVWSPDIVDNQNSATYSFTPSGTNCETTTTFTVTVTPNVVPTFSFGSTRTICAGDNVPALPSISVNGIAGSWYPSAVDNQNTGTYTFTPNAGICALSTTFVVTVNPIVTPTFSFGASLTACAGSAIPVLPNTSVNGINGTWNPSIVSDQNSGAYTFTPAAGQCATTAVFNVTINAPVVPLFSFGTSLSICNGAATPVLPGTSNNGITGLWVPSTVDNQSSGTYLFVPTAGECATTVSLTVTVNPVLTPDFSFGTALTACAGAAMPALSNTSLNGVIGSWSPSTVNDQASGVYTFTPLGNQCATPATFTVTITPNIVPTFSFGNSLAICAGAGVPALPPTSLNGIDGTWDPAVVNNQASGTYKFTASTPGQCVSAYTLTVTVNPILTPTFSFGTSQSICKGANVPDLPTTSVNGINGTWDPATVSNQESKIYTFTSAPGQCVAAKATFEVTVNEIPILSYIPDIEVFDGEVIPNSDFDGTPSTITFRWTNSNPAIGLAQSGTGNVPSFTATNMSNQPISATVTVTPVNGGCAGEDRNYNIVVKPLNKDVFVPNVFSPNGDGKNDILYVYGNYIDKVEMRIFNQWGEQIQVINSRTKGWDGTQRGKPQPVGVYVYVLKAVLANGKTVEMKGSITLLR